MKYSIILLLILLVPVFGLSGSPPVLETVKTQSLEVGKEFSLIIGHTDSDGDEVILSDNSDLFEITQQGLIKFVPGQKDEGIKEIVIIASDKEFTTQTKFKAVVNSNITEIKTDPQIIRINLKQKTNLTKSFSIINQNLNKLYAVLESKSDFISPLSTEIEVEPNSQKSFDLLILASDNNLQTGSITIYGGKKEKIIPVIVTQNIENSNIGLSLDISTKFRKLVPGQELAGDLTIVNLNKTKLDLEVEYVVKDLQNNEIVKTAEQLSVEREVKKTKKIGLPSFIGDGDYLLGVIVKVNGVVIESTAEFFSISKDGDVETSNQYAPSNLQVLVSIIIVILVSILLYMNYGRLSGFEKKKSDHAEKIYKDFLKDKQTLERAQETRQKLQKQLESLEKAYKMKIISESSYNKGRKRIESIVREIDKKLR